ncbi:uncharacterized protein LOC110510950 isoform X4 [Oncorhynchus mykiss]|nr:uncharacterized protein LOC110510950 isoform X4 [Oncorhynchus mykiss]XP_036825799.1 uncharacterized protein LOC110510950 isoform X4 [Oncorhynchus mykiss]
MGESGYADNNSVHTITSEEWEGAIQEEDPFGEDTRGLSLYQTVIMAVVGGALLLALNWLGCFLCLRWKKRRGQTESKGSVSDGKKSEGNGFTVFTASGSTRYEVRGLVNPAGSSTAGQNQTAAYMGAMLGRAPTTTTPPVTTAPLSTPTPREHKGKMAATTHWRP